MKPEWFLLHCQEMAELHASANNFGFDWAREHGLAWVEVQGNFELMRCPRWKEAVTLHTNTGQATPLQAHRFIDMADEGGELVARADIFWVLIDMNSRRPVPLKRADLTLPLSKPALPPPPTAPTTPPFISYLVTSRRDLDFNGHINNSAYLTWVLDSLPKPPAGAPHRIRVSYKHESSLGEALSITHRIADAVSEHLIEGGGSLRARLILEWA